MLASGASGWNQHAREDTLSDRARIENSDYPLHRVSRMNQLPIFAGLDRDDVLRFVGDVPRGAACGCRCAACGAALVAKRGEEKIWHFAHEASQERPDCFAGAVNLLRRLAIEQLRASRLPTLPVFRRVVSTRLPLPMLSDTVEVNLQPVSADRWKENPAHGAPVARLVFPDGTNADLLVEVQSRHAAGLAPEPGAAAVLVHIPLPLDGSFLRDLAAAKAYLENNRVIVWKQHPAGEALAASALKKLVERARALEHERTVLLDWHRREAPEASADSGAVQEDVDGTLPAEADNPAWVHWRKPNSSFIYYRCSDGNGWLFLQHQDGGHIIVPWPEAIEGWDEALPAKIGAPDHALGGYRVTSEVNAMVYLGRISEAGVRTFSSWSEVPRRPKT